MVQWVKSCNAILKVPQVLSHNTDAASALRCIFGEACSCDGEYRDAGPALALYESNLAPHLKPSSHHVLSLSMIGALDPIESPTVWGLWDLYTLTRRPSACIFFCLCISGAVDLWCHDAGEHSCGLVAMPGWPGLREGNTHLKNINLSVLGSIPAGVIEFDFLSRSCWGFLVGSVVYT